MPHAYTEWKNLSIRIKSLLQTCERLFGALQINNQNTYGALNELINEAKKIFFSIQSFKNNYEIMLSENVKQSLEEFVRDEKGRFTTIQPNQLNKNPLEEVKIILVALSTFESEISYYLSDTQTYIRKTVEISFAHLQRSLVVDEELREKWKKKTHETHFEKIGGVHLLSHKIWAFKSDASGERTDLILSEPDNPIFIHRDDPLYKSVDGLVLTEWKIANQTNYKKKIEDAKGQAIRYKSGSLYPLELSQSCYLVLVSEKHINFSKEKVEKLLKATSITYRLINIAYNPDPPSKK